MNWPNIRKFPVSAKTLIAIYTLLMGSILVVALGLSSWHHGLVTEKEAKKSAPAETSAPAAAKAEVKPDDGQSSGVVIEADTESTVKVKTLDWLVYENFKLGHTHLNGQSLVYFSLMVLFLMSTASERSKIVWGVLLAFSVILHTFGLFFMHKEPFGMMLRVSGALLALSITVMCFYIFVDTIKKPATS
ncbi:MAG: hypothetical protein U1F40_03160 [Turneriella sp.]